MKITTHNIGIAFSLEGMAICHSIWTEDIKLLIKDFWVEREGQDYSPVSAASILSQVDQLLRELNPPYSHVNFYISNEILIREMRVWLKNNHKSLKTVKPVGLIAPPSDAAVWIASELHSGNISATENISLELIKEAFSGISQDENGKAVGSPESIALLAGVGEPLYRVSVQHYRDKIQEKLSRIHNIPKDSPAIPVVVSF